jgi:MEMO1 family protein
MTLFLARLRADLEIVSSPVPDRPGLLLRDPLQFSDITMIIPPLLVRGLMHFDGSHSRQDLRELLLQLTNRPLAVDEMVDGLADSLSSAGFLDDETFRSLRAERRARFSRDPVRGAAFAGGGYPAETEALTRTLDEWLRHDCAGEKPRPSACVGIAAPHASPSAGVATYGAAYRALSPQAPDCTFVILGTSHYGALDRFGLTGKSFRTPLGEATTDVALVEQLARAAPASFDLEDYCHAVEHSIEFQVVFLQRLFGPDVRILPILCGPFSCGERRRATPADGAPDGDDRVRLPEHVPSVRDALAALADLQRREGERLRWVLGVDMAHVGPRYGDTEVVRAGDRAMNAVAARDQARLERITVGDADGFWKLSHQRGVDDLKWCGSSPLYTFCTTTSGTSTTPAWSHSRRCSSTARPPLRAS